MAQRKSVRGSRSSVLWLAIILILVLAIALAAVVFVIGPERQLAVQATATAQAYISQATATAQAHASEIQRAYDAGVAFAAATDWDNAAEEFARVVGLEPGYRDATARLAEVKAKLTESAATATAEAVAQAERARLDAQATATAQVHATATTQAVAATATATAVETRYQKALAYVNLERWAEAQVELQAVFEIDPNYKDIQTQLAEVETRLAEIRALTPPVTPVPTRTPTPPPTATPEIKSPSVRWLGFVGDQVSPSVSETGADGNSDGVFELILPDDGRTVIHILLATPDGREHWDTDGQKSWVLGVVEQASRQRLDKLGAPMDYYIDGIARLHLYASVGTTGFRPGQQYEVTVRFADGYSVELPIQIP